MSAYAPSTMELMLISEQYAFPQMKEGNLTMESVKPSSWGWLMNLLPTLLMIGNETEGLRRIYKEQSDVLTTIPMNPNGSASSINVACAATVMFYEAVRQRSRNAAT